MRLEKFRLLFVISAVFLVSLTALAQQKPPLSPPATAEATIEGKKVTITYNRPSMRGRKVFGELVPYNQVWRTGANKATTLKTEVDLVFGKLVVPAGEYTLFTLPSETGWKLIINKHTGQWGIPYKPEYEKEELGRVDMKVGKTAASVEMFTITLTVAKGGGALKMEWENTMASVNFKVKK